MQEYSELREQAKFMNDEERVEFFGLIDDGEEAVAEWYAEQARKSFIRRQESRGIGLCTKKTIFMRCGEAAIGVLSSVGYWVRLLPNRLRKLTRKTNGVQDAKAK